MLFWFAIMDMPDWIRQFCRVIFFIKFLQKCYILIDAFWYHIKMQTFAVHSSLQSTFVGRRSIIKTSQKTCIPPKVGTKRVQVRSRSLDYRLHLRLLVFPSLICIPFSIQIAAFFGGGNNNKQNQQQQQQSGFYPDVYKQRTLWFTTCWCISMCTQTNPYSLA